MTTYGARAKAPSETGDPEALARSIATSFEALPGERKRLPIYLTIGTAGSGKTAALVAAGMRPSASAENQSGCQLWVGERSLAVEVAGRLTTHDAPIDRENWLALLGLLAANRSKWTVGGIIVAVSVEDVMTSTPDMLGTRAASLRKRMREIRKAITVDLPVYVLFTKADLIAGFGASMRRLDEPARQKVWGVTLDPSHVPAADGGRLGDEFDTLVEQLLLETTDRMQDERDTGARGAIFEFPRQFASLRDKIVAFLADMVEPDPDGRSMLLRGFYFGSAAADGPPIDHLSVGTAPGSRKSSSDYRDGAAYFLGDLLKRHLPTDFMRISSGGRGPINASLLRYGVIAAAALAGIVLLSAWGVSTIANRALIEAADAHIERHSAELAERLGNPAVGEPDLETVVEALTALRTLPAGHAEAALTTPIRETFGLSQRAKLHDAAASAYTRALQAQLRPRLVLQTEQMVRARLTDPPALYEPLKVYLLLGDQAPVSDNALVTAWLTDDWERRLYPGPTNRAGRDELKAHLQAMLSEGAEAPEAALLDEKLVEAARRSLARIALPDLAWAEIASAAQSAELGDFSVAERAGESSTMVFEARDGRNLSALRIAGLYTHAGFNDFLLPQLASVAQRVVDSQWVMGEGSQQLGMEQQLRRIGPELLDRYARDFLSVWNAMLDNLRLVPLTAGEDGRKALEALASPSSPLRMLVEAVATETALTRRRFDGETQDQQVALAEGLARIGIDLANAKSQSQAGGALTSARGLVPGANVEAQFRPFQLLVDEGAGRRPIDALVQNFADIQRSLLLAANAPGQTDHVNANLQLQVHNLRVNASRLPRTLSRMVEASAEEFEVDMARASIEHLDTQFDNAITLPCEALVTNAYPFAPGSTQDASLSDFARMFAPGGEFDRFFALNLAPFADISGSQWRWKPDARISRDLSQTTLRAFQHAAEIREAFFPHGSSTPAVELTITPFSLQGGAETAQLEVNGEVVNSYQAGNVPVKIGWPGTASSAKAELILKPDLPGRPNSLRFEGPWALMRLLASGSSSFSGDDLQVQLMIGGRGATYTLQVDATRNPFALQALTQFRCPVGL